MTLSLADSLTRVTDWQYFYFLHSFYPWGGGLQYRVCTTDSWIQISISIDTFIYLSQNYDILIKCFSLGTKHPAMLVSLLSSWSALPTRCTSRLLSPPGCSLVHVALLSHKSRRLPWHPLRHQVYHVGDNGVRNTPLRYLFLGSTRYYTIFWVLKWLSHNVCDISHLVKMRVNCRTYDISMKFVKSPYNTHQIILLMHKKCIKYTN